MTSLLLAATAAAPAKQIHLSPAQIQQLMQAQAAAQPHQAPQTWFTMHAAWLTHGLAGLFVIAAIAMIVLLAAQTTKQEGLSGTIGGRVESSYGRMGADEQLTRLTGVVA
ncbi:MAG: preprotein translocase subunit SecG, partial [Rhodanobacteraceae bacterium]